MSKKEHLRKILNVDIGDPSYAEMDTEIRMYKKFIDKLKIDFFNEDADEIFVKLYNEGATLKSITSKSRGKTYLENKLIEIAKKQKVYYKEVIYPLFIKDALKRYSISDADIARNEHRYNHSIILTDNDKDIFNLDNFLASFLDEWKVFNSYIDKTLQLLFFDYYSQENLKTINTYQFKKIVEESIQEYVNIKEKHQNSKKEIQRENPYCNLYMYCRNAYILNYFKLDLPDRDLFKECKDYNIPVLKKQFYSLSDIAENYEVLTNTKVKAYDKIKKNFQSSCCMQKYKTNNGRYAFSELSIPLAHYIYYKKKNCNVDSDTDYFYNNYVIHGRVAPILNAKINNDHKRLEAVYKYLDFIKIEFRDIFLTLNNGYQDKMISFLNETIVNIFYRCMGLSEKTVYSNFYK